jgi:hypothetical protein
MGFWSTGLWIIIYFNIDGSNHISKTGYYPFQDPKFHFSDLPLICIISPAALSPGAKALKS